MLMLELKVFVLLLWLSFPGFLVPCGCWIIEVLLNIPCFCLSHEDISFISYKLCGRRTTSVLHVLLCYMLFVHVCSIIPLLICKKPQYYFLTAQP